MVAYKYFRKPNPKMIAKTIPESMMIPKFQKLFNCCCDGRSRPSYGGKLLYLQYKKKRVVSKTIVMQVSNCHIQLSLLPGFSQELAKIMMKKKSMVPNKNNCHVPADRFLFPKFQSNEF